MKTTNKHKIITFYSFKGGAGRSQLAVNLAAYLFFYAKKKVLLIDWDLEAPGLDAYFKNFDRKTIERGLLEVLEDYVKIMQEGRKLEIEDLPFLDEKSIYSLWHDEKTGAKIDLVPAINYNRENYTHTINSFDWFDFYDRLQGRYYMETLKDKLHATDYDYIFIDSRTGLSDYSGICNVQLPDANVIVVAPTQQNLNGAKMMIEKITKSPYTEHQRPQAVVLPVLSRIDLSEENMFVEWTNKFKNTFAEDIAISLKNAGLGIEVETYINDTTLRYVKELAYGENILFNENSNGITAGSLAEKFENILGYLEVIPLKEPLKKANPYIEKLLEKEQSYQKSIVFLWSELDFEKSYCTELIKYLNSHAKFNRLKIEHLFVIKDLSYESKKQFFYQLDESFTKADLIVLCESSVLIEMDIFPLVLDLIKVHELNKKDKCKIAKILIDTSFLFIKQIDNYNYLSTRQDHLGNFRIFSLLNHSSFQIEGHKAIAANLDESLKNLA